MFSLARIQLPESVTLTLYNTRPRVVGGSTPNVAGTGVDRVIDGFNACFTVNPVTRTIHAEIPPMPRALLIYGAQDFDAAAADTPEQHAERVLSILGITPQTYLQAIIDGTELPELPVRVPRVVANWKAKALLGRMGLIPAVEAALGTLSEPRRADVLAAWNGNGRLYRNGETVQTIASELALTPEQIDAMFVEAGSLVV